MLLQFRTIFRIMICNLSYIYPFIDINQFVELANTLEKYSVKRQCILIAAVTVQGNERYATLK